jgi:hypothetical protein
MRLAYSKRMNTIARLTILALTTGLLLACGAEPPPAPTLIGEQRIEAWPLPIQDGAGQPDLTTAPDGRVLLTWITTAAGRRPALQMAEWYADEHWEGPRTVVVGNALFVNWADTPHIAATADRALWVHWLQKSADAPYAYDIKLVRSLDHGMNWSAQRQVHGDTTTTEHGFVAFWPQSDNTLGVAWLDGRDTVGSAQADAGAKSGEHTADKHAAHKQANGMQADEKQADEKQADEKQADQKQAAHAGHDGHGGNAMTLRAAVFDAQLTASAESVLDARTCDCCQTSAAATASGALLVYRDRSDDEIRDIYAVRFDGKAWSAPKRVHADEWMMPACPVNGPAVAARGDRAVVAWYTAANDRPAVKLAASADGGTSFAPPVLVDEGAAVLGRVAIAMDANQAWVLWMREQAGQQSLQLARYKPDLSKRLQQVELAKIAGTGRVTGFPKIALRDGIAHIVWTEGDASGPRLRGMRVSIAAKGSEKTAAR